MSYRAFAIGTLIASPLLVMAVQSFTPSRHKEVAAPDTAPAPVVEAPSVPPPIETLPTVQDAPTGPAPVFGQPLAGAGQPMTPTDDMRSSESAAAIPDTGENF